MFELVDVVVDALTDQVSEVGVVLDAMWDEFLGLFLVLQLARVALGFLVLLDLL